MLLHNGKEARGPILGHRPDIWRLQPLPHYGNQSAKQLNRRINSPENLQNDNGSVRSYKRFAPHPNSFLFDSHLYLIFHSRNSASNCPHNNLETLSIFDPPEMIDTFLHLRSLTVFCRNGVNNSFGCDDSGAYGTCEQGLFWYGYFETQLFLYHLC